MTALAPVFLHADFTLAASAETVWSVLGDFRHPDLGRGFVASNTGSGDGVGALRALRIEERFGGGEVVERQTGRDDRGYYYAYELASEVPLPIEDYYGSVHAIPVTPSETRIVWTNRYRAPPELVDQLRERSLNILALIEGNLRELVETPVPAPAERVGNP